MSEIFIRWIISRNAICIYAASFLLSDGIEWGGKDISSSFSGAIVWKRNARTVNVKCTSRRRHCICYKLKSPHVTVDYATKYLNSREILFTICFENWNKKQKQFVHLFKWTWFCASFKWITKKNKENLTFCYYFEWVCYWELMKSTCRILMTLNASQASTILASGFVTGEMRAGYTRLHSIQQLAKLIIDLQSKRINEQ